jgi:hypothetical protein
LLISPQPDPAKYRRLKLLMQRRRDPPKHETRMAFVVFSLDLADDRWGDAD